MRLSKSPFPSCLPEGAAVSIGPVSPGQTDQETHVYIEPCQKNKALHMELIPCEAPCTFSLHLTLTDVAPGRAVLITLQLLVQTPEGQKNCGLRLVPVKPHCKPEAATVTLPPIGFLLPALSPDESGHYVLRVLAYYS